MDGTYITRVRTGVEVDFLTIKDADVIVLATTSEVTVIDGNLVKEGELISGVGSYMTNMHEIDEVSIKRASKIFCDSVDAVLEENQMMR